MLFCLYSGILYNLNEFLWLYGDFYNVYFLIKFYYLFDNFGWHWVRFLNCSGNLNRLGSSIFIGNFFTIWYSFLQIDCKMSGIWNNKCTLLFQRYSYSLSINDICWFLNNNRNLTNSSYWSKEWDYIFNINSIKNLSF